MSVEKIIQELEHKIAEISTSITVEETGTVFSIS